MIAAKSGMNVVVEPNLPLDDAWYDGRNTVYVNADADRSRTFSGLLGHEMWHRMFKSKRAKKLFMKAFLNIDEVTKQEAIDRYIADCKEKKLSVSDSINIANEEVAAAYAEELFHEADVWEYILSEEPTLSERVLSFFRGANKKYSFEEGISKEARKWLKEYKKLFSEVSAYNKGQNVDRKSACRERV